MQKWNLQMIGWKTLIEETFTINAIYLDKNGKIYDFQMVFKI